jgi:MFS family permease
MFSWGLVMTLMCLINSYDGLLVARWFLGVAESGFFPAATFLLTLWYRRYEVMRRMAVFYAAASLSGAFSGLLAFGIQHMDGIAGLAGWVSAVICHVKDHVSPSMEEDELTRLSRNGSSCSRVWFP